MKCIDHDQMNQVGGVRLEPGRTFCFRCHPAVSCFNRCCRNLNLFLYPYDVVRLRKRLGIDSDAFLDRYTDVVLRPDNAFPDVLLRMADNDQRTCPFLSTEGCTVYPDRPDTCRTFPVEFGLEFDGRGKVRQKVAFFRPPDFCRGADETDAWTVEQWLEDQQAGRHHEMTVAWAKVKELLRTERGVRWQADDPRCKMAFMAAYNIDRFRQFVFESSLIKRYRLKPALCRKMRTSDRALLEFAFQWIAFILAGRPSSLIRPR